MKQIGLALALLALAACGEKDAAEAPGSQPAAEGNAAAGEGGRAAKAASVYASLQGAWAAPGGCGDPFREWRIEPTAFHIGEAHCDVIFHQPLATGGRAVADCTIEGDNDGSEDSFLFMPQANGGLVIIDETTNNEFTGLARCPLAQ